MQVEFYGNHRNMTVSAPTLGLTITHRFTGHVDLEENMMGLDTFFHRDFQQEFGCLTDPQPGQGCLKRRPDFLVVNSGMACLMRPAHQLCLLPLRLAVGAAQLDLLAFQSMQRLGRFGGDTGTPNASWMQSSCMCHG